MSNAPNLQASVRERLAAANAKVEPLRKAWFTAAVSLLLTLALALPGLASSQVAEALMNHVGDVADPWKDFNWPTVWFTLFAFLTIGRALRHWTSRLLGIRPGDLHRQSRALRIFVGVIWAAPWAGLTLIFLQASITLTTYQDELGLGGDSWNPFTLLMLVAVSVPLGFYILSHLGPIRRWLDRVDANPDVQMWLDLFPIILFALGLVLLTIPEAMVPLTRFAGPPAILAFALAALVSFCGWSFIEGRRRRFPIFWTAAGLAIAFSAFDLNDNHPIRLHREPVSQLPATPADAFVRWMSIKGHPTRPVILVGAEGGGIRAAYFTAISLARIADRCPTAADRIFAINGVSGGAVGAAVFAAILHEHPLPDFSATPIDRLPPCDFGPAEPGPYEQRVNAVLRQDHLSPLLGGLLFPDTVQRFLPFAIPMFDRQLAFERGLAVSFRDAIGADTLSQSIYDMVPAAGEHRSTPHLLLNTTSVETGERVVAGNILFSSPDNVPNMRSFASMMPEANFPVVTLAATSARFPYLSPSGYVIAGGRKERFVDGGYFDNSGASTMIDLFNGLTDSNAPALAEHARTPFILIHIGNSPLCRPDKEPAIQGSTPAAKRKGACKPPERAYGSDEQMGPLRAVLSSREGRVSWTLEQLETIIRRTSAPAASAPATAPAPVAGPDEPATPATDGVAAAAPTPAPKARLLRLQMLDTGTPIPLGWLLSDRASREMTEQVAFKREGDACINPRDRSNGCTFDDLSGVFSPGAIAIAESPAPAALNLDMVLRDLPASWDRAQLRTRIQAGDSTAIFDQLKVAPPLDLEQRHIEQQRTPSMQ